VVADAAFGRIGGHDQERFGMHDSLFEAALGITRPWFVAGVRFDEASKVLTVGIDYAAGSGFALEGVAGEHPVHDSVTKSYRHLNFSSTSACQRWTACGASSSELTSRSRACAGRC
jgi:hypothetical protein